MPKEPTKEQPTVSAKLKAGTEAEGWAEIEKAPALEIKKEETLAAKETEGAAIKPARRVVPFLHRKPQEPEVILDTSETTKEIEAILSEGLNEAYQSLPENLKERFREKGRETASQIEKIISGTRVAVRKILDLVKRWLLIIPAVNKFFLEQESKIKTDKILGLAERKKKEKIQL